MRDETEAFDKEIFVPYFEQWSSIRGEIELAYEHKNSKVLEMMKNAICMYEQLLVLAGSTVESRSGKIISTLLPLNGSERLQFVKDKVGSHYAFVQLDALFLETKKKAARLAIVAKKTEA